MKDVSEVKHANSRSFALLFLYFTFQENKEQNKLVALFVIIKTACYITEVLLTLRARRFPYSIASDNISVFQPSRDKPSTQTACACCVETS